MKMFSVIIPVYNVEMYLEECIKSVICQTYKNYEIILVDDGSTDYSGKICDKYSEKYDFITTIHKKNGGLSSARNEGIRNAKAEYILFLDSDDYWDDCNALSRFENILRCKNVDVLIFGSKKYYEESRKFEKIKIGVSNLTNLQEMIKYTAYKASACNKIIKSSLIKDKKMLFPLNTLSEDITWCMNLIQSCNSFYYLDEPVYVYRQRKGSITHSKNIQHIMDIFSQCLNGIETYKNSSKKDLVYSFLDYEYCTALFLSTEKAFCSNEEINNNIENCKLLLDYGISKKVKLIRGVKDILGFKVMYQMLGVYYKMRCMQKK